jgi:hypothetical protein
MTCDGEAHAPVRPADDLGNMRELGVYFSVIYVDCYIQGMIVICDNNLFSDNCAHRRIRQSARQL